MISTFYKKLTLTSALGLLAASSLISASYFSTPEAQKPEDIAQYTWEVGAQPQPKNPQVNYHIIPVTEIAFNQAEMEAFYQGQFPEVAVLFPEDMVIPLKLQISGSLFNLNPTNEPLLLEVKQNLYLRNVAGQFLFSNDCSDWKNLQEAFSGNIGVSITSDDTAQLVGLLFAEIHKKS
ncbi:MAG: hypothetical protein ACQEP8_02505 [Chlamydiota bacterium]